MKTVKFFCICLLLVATVVIVACEEKPGVTTMRLHMAPEMSREDQRAIQPNGQGLVITSYAINGTGPNDNTFSITTNSSQVEISGLVIGTWELHVIGMNQQGTSLASGTKTHHLTTNNNVVEIPVNTLIGSGSAHVGFSWGDSSFTNMNLELFLTPQGGTTQQITSGISLNSSTATALYESALPSGSYQLSYQLYSEGTKIAGGIESLRIIDGVVTSGEITIVVDKESGEATGFSITTELSDPIQGSIGGIGSTILPNTLTSASFVHEAGGGSSSIAVEWFLDGVRIASGNSVSFSTYTGAHRLDAVASSDKIGSIGSVTHPFRASVASLNGIPLPVCTVTHGDVDPNNTPFLLNQVKDSAFLRDGRLLVASSDALQLCEMRQDELYVVATFTSDGPATPVQNDPYPVNGITDICIDTVDDIVCTTAGDVGTIVLYQYNSQQSSLQKLAAFDAGSSLWGSSITNAVLDRGNDMVFFIDKSTKKVHSISYAEGIFTEYNPLFLGQFDGTIAAAEKLAISSDAQRIGITSPSNKSFHTYLVSYDLSGSPKIGFESNTVLGASFSAGPLALALEGEKAQVMMEDGLHLFHRQAGTRPWQHSGKIDTENRPVVDMTFDTLSTKGWAIALGDTPSVTLYTLFGGVPSYSGQVSTPSGTQGRISYSPVGNFLSLSDTNKVVLLRISDR